MISCKKVYNMLVIAIKIIFVITGYLITFFITNFLIKKIVLEKKKNSNDTISDTSIIRDGFIIGKCENIIIISFVLVEEVTGLALVFAAKSLARQKDINKNAGFFLAGTMVNFTASLVIAYIIKFSLTIIDSLAII